MYKRLKNTTFDIFPVVLGSDYYGTAIPKEIAFANLNEYVQNGGNVIDTARIYSDGESEEIIGEFLRSQNLREKVVISTKAGHPPIGHMDIGRLSLEEIEKDVDNSLSSLQISEIDILWLHRDDEKVETFEIADAMDTLVKKGKIKCWGVSNWRGDRMQKLLDYYVNKTHQFVGGQIRWSLAMCCKNTDPTLVDMDKTEFEFYSKNNLPVFAYGSQGKGFFEKYDKNCLTPKAEERYLCQKNVDTYNLIKKISNESGFSLTALCLAYLVNQDNFDTFPIIGCSKTEYVKMALESTRVPKDLLKEILKIRP